MNGDQFVFILMCIGIVLGVSYCVYDAHYYPETTTVVCNLGPSERIVKYTKRDIRKKTESITYSGEAYTCIDSCGWDNTNTKFPLAQIEDMCGLKPGSLLKPGKRKVK